MLKNHREILQSGEKKKDIVKRKLKVSPADLKEAEEKEEV